MLLAHFGPAQADVYIPAVIALTIAAIVIALPLVFAPKLRRGIRLAVNVAAGVVALAAVGVAIALALPAQHVLAAQVPSLQRQIEGRYGLQLPDSIVSRLIDGSTVSGAEIQPYTHAANPVKLIAAGTGYVLVSTPTAAEETTQLPLANIK